MLCGGNLLTALRCHQRGLSSQSLGKYWQLDQSNQHISTYSRIQQQTKNPYYATIHNEYAQENPRINRQDRRRSRSLDLLTPRRSPSSTPLLYTQKQCTARGSSWGLPSLSLTTEGSWIHLGGGSPNLSSSRWRQYPHSDEGFFCFIMLTCPHIHINTHTSRQSVRSISVVVPCCWCR